jgi:S1-C subfamily serine protease
MFCRFCGSSLPDDSTFCQSCGKSLATTITPVNVSPTPSNSVAVQAKKKNQSAMMISVAVTVVLVVVGAFILWSKSGNSPETNSRQVPPQTSPSSVKPDPIPAATAIPSPTPPELTAENLFKLASPSVVLIEVFDESGQRVATGSGFVASVDGAIVTNYHVIRGAYSANLHLQDGSTIPVRGVIGFDQSRDVAVVKANSVTTRALTIGDSEKVQIGDRVIAIGSPLAIQNTMSDGLVSGIRNGLIQTSTPISPGSSGGPLFNTHGEVVGIAVSTITTGQNLNFAIPINWAKGYLQSSEVTPLADISKQNTVEQEVLSSTISVPAHQRRVFTIAVNRNRMSNPELEGTFTSSGGVGGEVRVFVVTQNTTVYDSGRAASGSVHLKLGTGIYQLVIDNSASALFPRSVTADFKFHYVK